MKLIKYVILLFCILSLGYANKIISDSSFYSVPVDTILSKNNLSFLQRTSINFIRVWQTYSYNNPKTNCQFYPSCSNYCAKKIHEHGTIPGLFIGADRYIRCNNSENLKEIINFKTVRKNKMINFNISDTKLIDPRNWK